MDPSFTRSVRCDSWSRGWLSCCTGYVYVCAEGLLYAFLLTTTSAFSSDPSPATCGHYAETARLVVAMALKRELLRMCTGLNPVGAALERILRGHRGGRHRRDGNHVVCLGPSEQAAVIAFCQDHPDQVFVEPAVAPYHEDPVPNCFDLTISGPLPVEVARLLDPGRGCVVFESPWAITVFQHAVCTPPQAGAVPGFRGPAV